MDTFSSVAKRAGLKTTATLRIVPERKAPTGPRNGSNYSAIEKQASDCLYNAGKAIASIYYKKIDERYPNRFLKTPEGQNQSLSHRKRFADARDILNEARNQILEAVIPLFEITLRDKDAVDTEADVHAYDYFVQNVFHVMVRTFMAWTDELVLPEHVETTIKTVSNMAEFQSEKLARELRNFSFQFRPIVSR